jgi:phage regulator Rha-like protein
MSLVRQLKDMEKALAQHKQIVAKRTLQNTVRKDRIEKKALKPAEKRELVASK